MPIMPGLKFDLDVYPDEAALLAGLQRGEKLACACLLRRFAGQVYSVGLRLTANPDEAEEVLQETFISACAKVGNFEGRSSLGTWLYRIATNAALMRLRKRQLETVSLDEPAELSEGDLVPRQVIDWTFEPGQQMLNEELREVMEQALAELPESLRVVFVLRDIQGLPTAETAEALGISQAAAKVRLHRARLQLRERLSAYFADDEVG
jgi:RNA polymerase sigma-70 factor (ECF subfamily)